MAQRGRERRSKRTGSELAAAWRGRVVERFRPLWLGWLTAIFVATPLIATDVRPTIGSSVGVILSWLVLLAVWLIVSAMSGQVALRVGPTSWALAAFLGLHTLSALVMADEGHRRSTLNVMWLWISMGAAFFLARQLLRTAAECRALIAVMISVAVCLSMLGYHQYFVSLPQARAAYEQDPEAALRQASVHAPPGSVERKLFENRLMSVEPISTFTLTNSLAAFLSPWLLAALGIAATNWGEVGSRKRLLLAALACAVLIGGCWVLTKSRTAWVATLCGLVLLALSARGSHWRLSWPVAVSALAGLVLLGALASVVGGLDWFVLAESSKSLLYRLEYWQASLQMVRDHPWFGCGPGHFQQYYQSYKLPQASETVATPHNFLFEIWATAGTPALLALLAVLLGFVWQLRRAAGGAAGASQVGTSPPGHVRSIYWGALVGVLLAYPLGAVIGYPPALEILAVGVPAAALALVAWHRWVMEGHLPGLLITCAIAVLLINLLGAGGISYAGVGQSLWLLMAVALNQAQQGREPKPMPRLPLMGLACAAAILLISMFLTMYRPILQRSVLVSQARLSRQRGQLGQAEQSLQAAARADPSSAAPWDYLAQLRHERWMASGSTERFSEFFEAARQVLERRSRSSQAHTQYGHWLLAAYRKTGDRQYLQEALVGYRRGAQLHPNGNTVHAQLAWAYHLMGDAAAADRAAKMALQLDRMNPHIEQKLEKQRIVDPGPGGPDQPAGPGEADAEQLMQRLRR